MDGQGWISGRGKIFFLLSKPGLGPTQTPIQPVLRPLSSKVQRHGREADQSPPFSAEVKNGGAIPPLPHTSYWCGNFTFEACILIPDFNNANSATA
jgi:hypothetical protein